MSKLPILKEQCETCIFRPGNPMKLRQGRVQGMAQDCLRHDSYIPCHETVVYTDDSEVASDDSPVCRGFYDRYPGVGQMIRISERLNLVEFIDPPQHANPRS